MASVWASVGSFFGAKESSSRKPAEKAPDFRRYTVAPVRSSTMPDDSHAGPSTNGRAPSASFEEASFTSNGSSYGPQAYITPKMQQGGFDNTLVSPTSQYPPSQSPISPASGARLRLNGQAMADDTHAPTTSYPHPKQTFARIAQLLGPVYPELLDTLGNPILPDDFDALTDALGRAYTLPRDVRESLACHDGQDLYSLSTSGSSRERRQRGLVWGLWLLASDEIGDDYRNWRSLEQKEMRGELPVDDPFAPAGKPLSVPGMASCPAGWVREEYSHPGWIPLLTDGFGNYIGVDLDPPSRLESDKEENSAWQQLAARPGQIIAYGREIDCKTVLFPGWGPDGGWARFLSSFADDLEAGEFGVLGHADEAASDDDDSFSADGLGEVGYFDEGTDRLGDLSFAEGGRKEQLRDTAPAGGSWRLRGKYAEMGIIEALCLRSRKRWAEVGLAGSEGQLKSSINGDLTRSESQRTVRPASPPQLIAVEPMPPPRAAISPEPSTSASVEDERPSSPVVTLGPPQPSTSHYRPPPNERARQPRRPPPPPATLDLPTLGEIDGFSTENLPLPISTTSSPRSSSDRRRTTLGEILPMSTRTPSPNMAARKGSFGLSSMEGKDRDGHVEVVVQGGVPRVASPSIGSPSLGSERSFGSHPSTSLDNVTLK